MSINSILTVAAFAQSKTLYLILGIVLLVAAVFLIIAVILQNGKSKGLSGTIAGGAETFFGKNKAKSIDKKLSVLTTIVAIVFVLIVIGVYVSQDYVDYEKQYNDFLSSLLAQNTATDTDTASGDTSTDTSTSTDTQAAATDTASGADATDTSGADATDTGAVDTSSNS